MFYDDGTELYHYGMPRRSGRYPWGSGENPFQHDGDFLSYISKLEDAGMSETEIAEKLQISTTDFRSAKRYAAHERRKYQAATARSLHDDGLNNSEIARKMGIGESQVRQYLNPDYGNKKLYSAENIADKLIAEVESKGIIDVGAGVERELGVSKEGLKEALVICQMKGYPVYGGRLDQITNPNSNQKTTITALCPKDTEHKELYSAMKENRISTVTDYHSNDGGETFEKLSYPKSIDSKRIMINYGDQGGAKKDGVIELRRGVEDISLGNSQYAQVRIAVDGTHYLKGMAMYADDMPPGVDIIFNTNKKSGTPMLGDNGVLKKMKDNPDNPFGATIKPLTAGGQRYYIDENGNKQLSVINKVRDEGDWDKYSDSLSAQFLAKQSRPLIKSQLDLTYNNKLSEFEQIKDLTNPTVKKKLLQTFADECDGAAVHLKAAGLPRQSWQVILPVTSLKDNEIYAPNYNHGESVALVRYPHGGIFEIPIVTVNNRHKESKARLGQTTDAVGINSKVAERLSGADFDGDTVLVIPVNDKVRIQSKNNLQGLVGFDPKKKYSSEGKEGVRLLKKSEVQKEMGTVSNLITDMTIKGATDDELAMAVRHSMVVIDAEKHKLDYKQSEIDNNISYLKKKYQNGGGASTLISLAKSQVRIPEVKGQQQINYDRKTGKARRDDLPLGATYYNESGRVYAKVKDPVTKKNVSARLKEDGQYHYYSNGEDKIAPPSEVKLKPALSKTTRMANTSDAHTLSSGHLKEELYANYANKMKTLGNAARIEMLNTGNLKYSPSAAKAYGKEVSDLDAKLKAAELNKPKERLAQRIATAKFEARHHSNPDMSKEELKRARQQELDAARIEVGAKKPNIEITPREWEAIQAGAISDNKLSKIIDNSDKSIVKQYATPKGKLDKISSSNLSRMKSMASYGYTYSEIARSLGISTSTVQKYLSE